MTQQSELSILCKAESEVHQKLMMSHMPTRARIGTFDTVCQFSVFDDQVTKKLDQYLIVQSLKWPGEFPASIPTSSISPRRPPTSQSVSQRIEGRAAPDPRVHRFIVPGSQTPSSPHSPSFVSAFSKKRSECTGRTISNSDRQAKLYEKVKDGQMFVSKS
jgi:hypothetical protein